MTSAVEVQTGARLHFGLLALQGDKRLGGVGMMVDGRGYRIRAIRRPSAEDRLGGPAAAVRRCAQILQSVRKHSPPESAIRFSGIQLDLIESPSPHIGYGSGTQLVFGLLRLLRELGFDLPEAQTLELTRGERSLVGTGGFAEGGLIYDPGTTADGEYQRFAIPSDWRVVVVEPTHAVGPSGAQEQRAFAELSRTPQLRQEETRPIVESEMLPALLNCDFAAFARAVSLLNRRVGEQFAALQGGVFGHPLIRELAELLQKSPWPYLFQSSWGPTAGILCESHAAADECVGSIRAKIPTDSAILLIVSPRNAAALVRRITVPS